MLLKEGRTRPNFGNMHCGPDALEYNEDTIDVIVTTLDG
jgi:hypothetical protein